MSDFIYKTETYQLIGLAMEVHKILGPGFLEAVYQEAFEIELLENKIPYQREAPLTITYKGKILEKKYIADFLCFNKIVVELKALTQLDGSHESQILNYLKATGFKVGLLINFGQKSLEYKRIAAEYYFKLTED